jgi:hypothetical protein
MVGLSSAKICGASEWCNPTNDDEGDVLSGFETLKVCTGTTIKGKILPIFLITLSPKM